MVVVKRLTVDSILCVVHPYLTDGGEFEQSEIDHRVVVALIAQVPEEHLPGSKHLRASTATGPCP